MDSHYQFVKVTDRITGLVKFGVLYQNGSFYINGDYGNYNVYKKLFSDRFAFKVVSKSDVVEHKMKLLRERQYSCENDITTLKEEINRISLEKLNLPFKNGVELIK